MNNTKSSPNRLKKEKVVAELLDKVNKSQSIVFADYTGLTHLQLEKIKKTLKKLEAEFVITKNTLIKIALKDKLDVEKEKDKFQKPTATLFMFNDVAAPLKEFAKLIKEFTRPEIKFGIFENKIITPNEVNNIATLPPLPVLRAQLLGQMLSPISGLHRSLNWNLQKLVLTLNAIKDKKS